MPETTPVLELMLIPSGRLVALYVSVSPGLASMASASKLMTAPSASDRSPNSVLKTGATLSRLGDGPGEGVGVIQRPVADGQDDLVACRSSWH